MQIIILIIIRKIILIKISYFYSIHFSSFLLTLIIFELNAKFVNFLKLLVFPSLFCNFEGTKFIMNIIINIIDNNGYYDDCLLYIVSKLEKKIAEKISTHFFWKFINCNQFKYNSSQKNQNFLIFFSKSFSLF